MQHCQHVHVIADPISDEVGRSGEHQLARTGDAAGSADHGIVSQQRVHPRGNLVHQPQGGGRTVLRDVIRDLSEAGERGAGPENPRQAGRYRCRSRLKSASPA